MGSVSALIDLRDDRTTGLILLLNHAAFLSIKREVLVPWFGVRFAIDV